MEVKDILIQGVGFLAMGMGIISYQFNKRKTLLIIQAVMGLTWAAHFLLLGQMTGMLMNIAGTLRSVVYSNKDKKWASFRGIPFFFSALFIGISILTYDGAKTLLPMAAMVFASFSLFSDSTKKLRVLMIPCCVLWGVYDALCFSWAGTANEIFVFCSVIVAMIRFDRPRAQEKNEPKQEQSSLIE